MSKTWFILIGSCLLNFLSFCQNTYIPDNNFEQVLIDLGYDSVPLDNFIPTNNITGITELNLINNPDLPYLDCGENQLETLNLSKNLLLNTLLCAYNNLSELDLSPNQYLRNFRM